MVSRIFGIFWSDPAVASCILGYFWSSPVVASCMLGNFGVLTV